MAVGVQQQQRRATEAQWVTSGKILANGEIGYATDSKIIKLGDGVNTWDNLAIPYDGRYLPITGKAADSEMLDGISSAGFLLVGDAAAAATAGKLILRDGAGRGKVVAGAASGDIVEYDQMIAADVVGKQSLISRTVTAAFTLALTDIGKTILVNNSSYTTFACNIPANATVAFPIGSVVNVLTTDKGPVTLTPAGGVTLTGPTALPGGVSSVSLAKTGTNAWLVIDIRYGDPVILRRKIKPGSDNTLTSGLFKRLRLDGADDSGLTFSNNYDSLGTNEQYNSSTDLYRAFCRRAGWYAVGAQISSFEAIGGRFFCQLRINNTEYKLGAGNATGSTENSTGFNALIPLNVGDYMEVWTYQDGTGDKVVDDAMYSASFLEWVWRRPL